MAPRDLTMFSSGLFVDEGFHSEKLGLKVKVFVHI